MNKWKLFIGIVLLVVILQTVLYYRGFYFAPESKPQSFDIKIAELPSEKAADLFKPSNVSVLLDVSHENNFKPQEVEGLLSRLSARGAKIELLRDSNNLAEKLKPFDAFVVISPKKGFEPSEAKDVKAFVEKNGRLFVVADPDRDLAVNSLLTEFGMFAEYDYLYNLEENDGNFRFIYVKKFAPHDVTRQLSQIALYNACSITAEGKGIAFTDGNTLSASQLGKNSYSPMAASGNVLALCDQTFLENEFNSVLDNPQLLSNLADWISSAKKSYGLVDYPHFFKGGVSIVAESDLTKSAISLRSSLASTAGQAEVVREHLANQKNQITIATYDSPNLSKHIAATGIYFEYLGKEKVAVNGSILTGKNSAVVILTPNKEGHSILILGSNNDSVDGAVKVLSDGSIAKHLLTENIAALIQKEQADKPEEKKEEKK